MRRYLPIVFALLVGSAVGWLAKSKSLPATPLASQSHPMRIEITDPSTTSGGQHPIYKLKVSRAISSAGEQIEFGSGPENVPDWRLKFFFSSGSTTYYAYKD
ncbi:MAG TPA: hypothetical protein VGE74_14605 [Gemmata sp.]